MGWEGVPDREGSWTDEDRCGDGAYRQLLEDFIFLFAIKGYSEMGYELQGYVEIRSFFFLKMREIIVYLDADGNDQ